MAQLCPSGAMGESALVQNQEEPAWFQWPLQTPRAPSAPLAEIRPEAGMGISPLCP